MSLQASALTADSVYIVDGNGKKHPTNHQLVDNDKIVHVIPNVPYQIGEKYMLMITTAVRASDGKQLKESVEVPFRVVNPTEKIVAVQSVTNDYFTTLTVTASPDVHTVKVGTVEMDYKGNNRYKLTFPDVTLGSTVNLYAYDETGKRIGTEKHKIE